MKNRAGHYNYISSITLPYFLNLFYVYIYRKKYGIEEILYLLSLFGFFFFFA